MSPDPLRKGSRTHSLKLSVVIPAYNEEGNLPGVITGLQEALQAECVPYEIIIVNDNSSDRTAEVIQRFIADDPRIRTVNRQPPGGFGRAIRSGLEIVTGDVVVIYMADQSDHPCDALRCYFKIEEGYDCVFGSRFTKESKVTDYPRKKLIANRIVNKALQWMFRCSFNDLTNAFKAYRIEVIRACGPYRASHFNITIEMSLTALTRNYYIAQIPIGWTGRTWGSSNLRLQEMGRRYLSTLLKVLAERWLISDDLLSERFAQRDSTRPPSLSPVHLAERIERLEQRIAAIEAQKDNLQSNPPRDAAA